MLQSFTFNRDLSCFSSIPLLFWTFSFLLTLSLDLVSSFLGPLSMEPFSRTHRNTQSFAQSSTTTSLWSCSRNHRIFNHKAFCFLLPAFSLFSLFKPILFFSFLVLFKCSTSLFLVSLGFVFPFFFLLHISLTLLLLLTTRSVHSILNHILFGPVRLLFLSLSLCPCAPSLSCLIVNLINRTFSRSHLLFSSHRARAVLLFR